MARERTGKPLELVGPIPDSYLTVLWRRPTNYRKMSVFMCRCVCGKRLFVRGTYLKTGHTRSCGCMKDKMRKSA